MLLVIENTVFPAYSNDQNIEVSSIVADIRELTILINQVRYLNFT